MLFLYFLFWTSMYKIKFHSYVFFSGKCAVQNLKDYVILVYGHFENLTTYQRAKIEMMI